METDTLLTIAEVAAGFIGFSAIATIFLGRDSLVDMVRFKAIVLLCLIVIWASFVPIWIQRFLGAVDLWAWATICSFVLTLPYVFWLITQVRRMDVGTTSLTISGVGVFATVGGLGALLIATPLAVVQITDWPIDSNQELYELILCCFLSTVAFVFIDLVATNEGKHHEV